MKKYYYAVLIIILGIICVYLTGYMVRSSYFIKENLVETMEFRNCKIRTKVLKEAKEMADKKNYDFSKIIAVNYLENNNSLTRLHLKGKKIKRSEKMYIQFSNQEYQKIYRGFAAIFNDLKYFPIAKSKSSEYWVGYDNSLVRIEILEVPINMKGVTSWLKKMSVGFIR